MFDEDDDDDGPSLSAFLIGKSKSGTQFGSLGSRTRYPF